MHPLRIEIALDLGRRQQASNPVGLIERDVERKGQVRHPAQIDPAGDQPPQKTGAALERGHGLGRLGAAERHHENTRIAQIGAHPHFGDGDVGLAQQRIAAFAVAQDFRQRVAQLFSHSTLALASAAVRLRACEALLPVAPSSGHPEPLRSNQ